MQSELIDKNEDLQVSNDLLLSSHNLLKTHLNVQTEAFELIRSTIITAK